MRKKWLRWINHLLTGYFICRTLHLMLAAEWGVQVVIYAVIATVNIICDIVDLTDKNY